MNNKIFLLKDDITKVKCDAIVNAANTGLLGGGGVDGAIHKAGGKQIAEACKEIRARQGGCQVGEAVLTTAGHLPAKNVIHTVGPIWKGGNCNEPELLRNCYKNVLEMALKYQLYCIAFPNISTGVYRFPKKLAAEIAIDEVKRMVDLNSEIEQVLFVCYDEENYHIYMKLLHGLKE